MLCWFETFRLQERGERDERGERWDGWVVEWEADNEVTSKNFNSRISKFSNSRKLTIFWIFEVLLFTRSKSYTSTNKHSFILPQVLLQWLYPRTTVQKIPTCLMNYSIVSSWLWIRAVCWPSGMLPFLSYISSFLCISYLVKTIPYNFSLLFYICLCFYTFISIVSLLYPPFTPKCIRRSVSRGYNQVVSNTPLGVAWGMSP